MPSQGHCRHGRQREFCGECSRVRMERDWPVSATASSADPAKWEQDRLEAERLENAKILQAGEGEDRCEGGD